MTTKVTRNFQITLPPEVRDEEEIEVGDTIAFSFEKGEVHIFKLRKNALDEAFGIWGKGPSGKTEQRKLRKEWEQRPQAD